MDSSIGGTLVTCSGIEGCDTPDTNAAEPRGRTDPEAVRFERRDARSSALGVLPPANAAGPAGDLRVDGGARYTRPDGADYLDSASSLLSSVSS
ncbi:hypothetical protein GCM10007147_39740 [Nocardiopsis kunsanensis]|uniref:Uncharacterized protein n=1 Tax=Nocardiopsis kunsanensis TaxID=141693 RepID=A0A918XIW7_9ACTN|nr:hypothetical protein GCM10007147_39740 [Nocardiopsis kunsanensis]